MIDPSKNPLPRIISDILGTDDISHFLNAF
jgi:hypothetical protein